MRLILLMVIPCDIIQSSEMAKLKKRAERFGAVSPVVAKVCRCIISRLWMLLLHKALSWDPKWYGIYSTKPFWGVKKVILNCCLRKTNRKIIMGYLPCAHDLLNLKIRLFSVYTILTNWISYVLYFWCVKSY